MLPKIGLTIDYIDAYIAGLNVYDHTAHFRRLGPRVGPGSQPQIIPINFLYPPSGLVDGTSLQTLVPDCPIIIVDGARLAKYAASYAFLSLKDLRQPDEGDDMGQYTAPSPISFVANSGPTPPTLIIYRSEESEPLPAVRDIIITISEENQTSIVVEFAFIIHNARRRSSLPRSLWKESIQLEGQ